MHLAAIIAAGGIGSRMGTGSSKQLMALAGRPVLAHSVEIFEGAGEVEEIVIVIDAADVERCRAEIVEAYGYAKVRSVTGGGAHRSASVSNGLSELGRGIDTVLVHDGARPLFPIELLEDGLMDLSSCDCDGIVFGLPVTDTVKEVEAGGRAVESTLDRSRLWAAQTPQIFKREILEEAYRVPDDILARATDDASLVERAGGRVMMTEGSPENIKITRPEDIIVAEEILRRRENLSE